MSGDNNSQLTEKTYRMAFHAQSAVIWEMRELLVECLLVLSGGAEFRGIVQRGIDMGLIERPEWWDE
jgi:hypothetical protein